MYKTFTIRIKSNKMSTMRIKNQRRLEACKITSNIYNIFKVTKIQYKRIKCLNMH